MKQKILPPDKQHDYINKLLEKSWKNIFCSWFYLRALKRHVKKASFDETVQGRLILSFAEGGYLWAEELLLLQAYNFGISEGVQVNSVLLLEYPQKAKFAETLLLLQAKSFGICEKVQVQIMPLLQNPHRVKFAQKCLSLHTKEHKLCSAALNTAGNLSAEELKKSDSYAFLRDIFESYHFTDMVKEGNFAKSYLMDCIKENGLAAYILKSLLKELKKGTIGESDFDDLAAAYIEICDKVLIDVWEWGYESGCPLYIYEIGLSLDLLLESTPSTHRKIRPLLQSCVGPSTYQYNKWLSFSNAEKIRDALNEPYTYKSIEGTGNNKSTKKEPQK